MCHRSVKITHLHTGTSRCHYSLVFSFTIPEKSICYVCTKTGNSINACTYVRMYILLPFQKTILARTYISSISLFENLRKCKELLFFLISENEITQFQTKNFPQGHWFYIEYIKRFPNFIWLGLIGSVCSVPSFSNVTLLNTYMRRFIEKKRSSYNGVCYVLKHVRMYTIFKQLC